MRRLCQSLLLVCIAAPSLTTQQWREVAPMPAREGHALAYDSRRGRTVLFGGQDDSIAYGETWVFDTSWTHIATAVAPTARSHHALAHDSARDRMVLFGGWASTGTNDTWEFDGVDWKLVPIGIAPPARHRHALVYDSIRQRTVLFGGWGSPSGLFLDDTWEYDGTSWTRITTAVTPPVRADHALAFDPSRGRSVMFGGRSSTSYGLGDTWEYDGSNWTQITTAAVPPPRAYHALAFDTGRARTVMFGGWRVGNPMLADTWEYDGTNWSRVATTAAVPARHGHALAFDPVRARTVLFGGQDDLNNVHFADTWRFDGTNWTQTPTPIVPQPRAVHALAYDSVRARTVLFGGGDARFAPLADTWEFDGANWRQRLTANSPISRYYHALAYDSVRGRTVLFGGTNGGNLSDTWEFDGSNWLQAAPAVSPPARLGHALAHDSARARTVLFGGTDGTRFFADTWEYDGSNWTQVTTAGVPPQRFRHALTYDSARGRTVLFGGGVKWALGTFLADTWEFNGSNWMQIPTVAAPPARRMHALAYDSVRGRSVLFGGEGDLTGWLADTWEYDGRRWNPIATGVGPGARIWHALAYDSGRGRTVLFGGRGAEYRFTETWELVPAPVPTWTRHGPGCAGSAGTPSLDRMPRTLPALGTVFPLQFTALPASAGVLYLAFGSSIARWNGVALPFDLGPALPGCMLWIEPASSVLVAHPGGAATFPLTIPNHGALAGVLVATQALVFDPAAGNGIGAVSNAGVMRLY